MPEEEGVGPGDAHTLGHRRQADAFQEGPHAHPHDEFAGPLPVLAVFRPPLLDLGGEFLEFIKGVFHAHEGHDDPAHLGAFQDGGVGAEENRAANIGAGPQGLGHQIDTVHAVVAFPVVDLQIFTFEPHALGGAQGHDIFLDVQFGNIGAATFGFQFAADVRGYRGLVNPDVVFPDTDHGHVGTGHGGDTVIGATGEFQLIFVGEGRPMHFELEFLGQLIAGFHGVVAGPFATGLPTATGGAAHS